MTDNTMTMAEGTVVLTGSSVEDATQRALEQLGCSREQVVIEVLSQGSAPVPGESLTGSEPRVRVTRVEPLALRGKQILEGLLTEMGIPTTITVRRAQGSTKPDAPTPPYILDVSGDDLGLLIGWRGETLRALQTVLNLILDQEMGEQAAESRRLIVDVERYRARREDQVREMALRLAQRVKRSGERYTLDPMHAYERRIVHLALENDSDVRTESSGKEPSRRVIIHPTGPAQGGDYAPRRSGWRDHR